MKYYLMLSTIDDNNKAIEISKHLVENKISACVNILPKVSSIYRWKGKIYNEKEHLMLIKITGKNLNNAIQKLKKLHPYETPEIIYFEIKGGEDNYLKWLNNSSGGNQ